jgi:hypothetical protein
MASSDEQKAKVSDLLSEFSVCFAERADEYGIAKVSPMKVQLASPSVQPFFARYRSKGPAIDSFVVDKIREWELADRISPSTSFNASAVHAVPKPHSDELRLVVDLRPLNAQTVVDRYAPRPAHELFMALGTKRFFSKFDFSNAYLQIPIEAESRHLFAFNSPVGQFQFNFAPFGFVNSGAKLQRELDHLFKGCPDTFDYVDDWIVASETFEGHLAAVREFFLRVRSSGFLLKPTKAMLFSPN